MTYDEQVEAVNDVADEVDGTVRPRYSGRSMFGDTCYGIVCSDTTACIEAASVAGLKGARTDSMGRDFIVYWPSIKGKPFDPKDDE